MNLAGYYKRAALYPFLIVVSIVIPFSIADNYNYRSEWMTAGEVIFLSIAWAAIYALIVSVLATTMFLNKFEKVRSNKLLALLSWFLLPFGFIGIVVLYEIEYDDLDLSSNFIYILIINVPFVLGLIRSYYRYRKANPTDGTGYERGLSAQ